MVNGRNTCTGYPGTPKIKGVNIHGKTVSCTNMRLPTFNKRAFLFQFFTDLSHFSRTKSIWIINKYFHLCGGEAINVFRIFNRCMAI
jgi:hypothetical protein